MKHKKALKITALILAIFLLLFSAASLIFVRLSMRDTFSRTPLRDYYITLRYSDVADRYTRQPVTFPSGENQLRGYLYGAENPGGLVVVSHGLGGGGEGYLAETLYFVDAGYQVLAYDNTGCCESGGKDSVGLSQSLLDLDAALTWVESQPSFAETPIFLYGHSWGGYAVAAIFHFDHRVTASASVAGFNDPYSMILDWAGDMLGPLTAIEAPYIWLDQKCAFGQTLSLTAADALNSTGTPVLILQGANDAVVGANTVSIYAARDKITNPNVQYLLCDTPGQDGHNTLFRSPESIAYAARLDAEYEALRAQYGGEIPEEADRAFCAAADHALLSQVDPDFMEAVVSFYRAQN